MFKKKLFLFVILSVCVIALLTFQSITKKGPSAGFPTYPVRLLEQVFSYLSSSAAHVLSRYILIVGKEDENNALRKQVMDLQSRLNQYTEDRAENERLRNILQLKKDRADYVTSAEVFARDPGNWFQTMWINKGSRDGIKKDMVAITPQGPVGRIFRVFDRSSSLIIITDVNSAISVRLQSSRVEGIMEGMGVDRCFLKYIPKNVNVSAGDSVITSGLDGMYPEGLMAGRVIKVEKEGDEIFQNIEVLPSSAIHTVEEVAVLKY